MRIIARILCATKVLPQAAFLFLMFRLSSTLLAQEQNSETKASSLPAIEIPDTPKTIDPDTLVPAPLAKKVTVTFEGEQFKKVMNWLQQESNIKVNVDYKSLASVRLIETDPMFEKLEDAPIYVLLGRLEMLGVGWYMEDNVLHVTSRNESLSHEFAASYNLGDLFDAGYLPQDLLRTINLLTWATSTTQAGENEVNRVNLIGDVLFVRHPDKAQRELAGLLAAIRHHGRRTFTNDSPQNESLRKAMTAVVSVDFQETPLLNVAQELSRQAKVPIRLDRNGLAASSLRDKMPVSLKASEQKLGTVFASIHSTTGVTWYLRDNVIWITSDAASQMIRKTAVFDVRDLCRDREESEALKEAIQRQSRTKWRSGEGSFGYMEIPKPGVLVARHTESALDEVLELLENYRSALSVSKIRTYGPPGPDPKEVVTGYYRLPHPMAVDLKEILPRLIQPETWKSGASPESVGEILEISSDSRGGLIQGAIEKGGAKAQLSENAILVIKQTRTAHQQIGKLIDSLLNSKPIDVEATLDTTKKPKSSTVNFGSSLRPTDSK